MTRLTCAVVIACGSVAFAEQQSPVSIPKDLVMLLMRGGLGTTPDGYDIMLGAPADFPRELLPPGARPLISTVTRSSTMVIAEAPNLAPDAAPFERQLAAAGWTVSPRMSSQPQRGLLAAAPSQTSSLWCHGGRYATVMLFPRPAGGSYVRASVSDPSLATPPAPMSPCTPMPQPMQTSSFADVDMPLLYAPAGSRALGYGGGMMGGNDSYDQRLRLETTLALPDVLKHYREQIEKHGWTFQSQAIADGIGVVRFSLQTVKKEPVIATFTVMAVPGTPPMEITLHLVRATTMR